MVVRPLVVTGAFSLRHTAVVLQEEPLRAVATLVAGGGTLYLGSLVQTQPRTRPPGATTLLRGLVDHIGWTQISARLCVTLSGLNLWPPTFRAPM